MKKTTQLPYKRKFTPEQYKKLSEGFIPKEMEDKWSFYIEDNTLLIRRSWTGFCIYMVYFDKDYNIIKTLANRDPKQYSETDDDYDTELLDFLISNFLLGENKPFPLRSNEESKGGIWQHVVAGTGYNEVVINKGNKPTNSKNPSGVPYFKTLWESFTKILFYLSVMILLLLIILEAWY